MKCVATADGRRPLSRDARIFLEQCQRHVLPTAACAVDELPEHLDGPALATALPTPGRRRDAVRLGTIMVFVDPSLDAEAVDLVARIAAALGVDEGSVDDLWRIAHRQADEAQACVMRRSLRWMTGLDMPTFRQAEKANAARDTSSPAVVDRYERLLDRAEGTLGHELGRYYANNGFPFPGTQGGHAIEVVGLHDVHHVLAGYPTSINGEFALAGFTASVSRREPLDHLVFVLLTWHVGNSESPTGVAQAAIEPEHFFDGIGRGAHVHLDVTRTDWDWAAYLDHPLDELREQIGVPDGFWVGPMGHWQSSAWPDPPRSAGSNEIPVTPPRS